MTQTTVGFLEMAATLYGVGAAAAVLLQARQMLRRRGSCDVSVRFFAVYVGGYAIWLLYGLSIASVPRVCWYCGSDCHFRWNTDNVAGWNG